MFISTEEILVLHDVVNDFLNNYSHNVRGQTIMTDEEYSDLKGFFEKLTNLSVSPNIEYQLIKK